MATKCDKEKRISGEEGERLAKQHNMLFYETSSLEGTNVQESFVHIVRNIKDKQQLNKKSAVVSLNSMDQDTAPKQKSGCC